MKLEQEEQRARPQWDALLHAMARQDDLGQGADAVPARSEVELRLNEISKDEFFDRVVPALLSVLDEPARGPRVLTDIVVLAHERELFDTKDMRTRDFAETLWGHLNAERRAVETFGPSVYCDPFHEKLAEAGYLRLSLAYLGFKITADDLKWDRGFVNFEPIFVLSELARENRISFFSDYFLLFCYQGWIAGSDLPLHWTDWQESYEAGFPEDSQFVHGIKVISSEQKVSLGQIAFYYLMSCGYKLASARLKKASGTSAESFTELSQSISSLFAFTFGETSLYKVTELAKQEIRKNMESQCIRGIRQSAERAQNHLNTWRDLKGVTAPDHRDDLMSIVFEQLALTPPDLNLRTSSDQIRQFVAGR